MTGLDLFYTITEREVGCLLECVAFGRDLTEFWPQTFGIMAPLAQS